MRKSSRRWRAIATAALAVLLAVVALALVACGDDSEASDGSGIPGSGTANTIVGAGASFPYPLYSAWGSEYNSLNGVKLNYQSIGSGGGISAISAKTVDFGGSDAPLEPSELQAAGLMQWPQCVGGVVLVVNLDGVENNELKLTAELVAKIYNGDISRLERPRAGRRERRGQAPRHQDQRRAPLGQLGHDLDLHELPRGRGR